MSWLPLQSEAQWQEILSASQDSPQLIFKHSTRCSISSMILSRFEGSALFQNADITCWMLDLIAYREVSNFVASETQVWHESPQCIVIDKSKVIYAESHGSIDAKSIQTLMLNK
jgi:bacillithiol system protein YtxJ